jgi:dTDP-4-dehydrorhamnose reductase
MKIVVIGKNGQLSSEFRYLKEADQNWKFLSSTDLDITNKFNVLNYYELYPSDIIIN